MKPFASELKKTLEVLRSGGIILYPTDTVWGIGCDATNAAAIKRIHEVKQRMEEKSFILLLDHESKLHSYVKEVPDQAWTLIEYSEKPLTIVYSGAKNLPEEAVSPDGSVAIRITRDEFCKDLISALRKPLISTSANISGAHSPRSFGEIDDQLKSAVDYVVDWRQNDPMNPSPSSIISLGSGGQIRFIRR